MCKTKDCDRHEFDYGLCLVHLKEKWLKDGTLVVETAPVAPKRKSRKKKVDAEVVTINDNTEELETREN